MYNNFHLIYYVAINFPYKGFNVTPVSAINSIHFCIKLNEYYFHKFYKSGENIKRILLYNTK